MKSTVKRYGLYSALTLIVLFALSWIIGAGSDYGSQETIGYISIVVALSFVFFGIKHFRDAVNGGSVTFGKALKIGVLITLFASVAFGILDIVYKLINPEFITEYYDTMVEQVKETVPADQLEATVKDMAASIAEAPLSGLVTKKEMWHTQADLLGWGAQFRYTTSLNSWLRMANPVPQEGESGMRRFMRERKEQQARGEATDY